MNDTVGCRREYRDCVAAALGTSLPFGCISFSMAGLGVARVVLGVGVDALEVESLALYMRPGQYMIKRDGEAVDTFCLSRTSHLQGSL